MLKLSRKFSLPIIVITVLSLFLNCLLGLFLD